MAKTKRVARTTRASPDKKTPPREGEVLPPQARKQISVLRTEMTRGPLPPPGMLKDYNAIVPGSAQRFMKQFEQISEQEIKCETRGQYFGFALLILAAILGIGGIVLLAWLGAGEAAWPIALIVVALAAPNLIKAFLRKDD